MKTSRSYLSINIMIIHSCNFYRVSQRTKGHNSFLLTESRGRWFWHTMRESQELISLDGIPKTELNPKTNVTAFATKFLLTLSKLLNNNVTNNWALEYISCNIGALSSSVDLLDCRGPRDVNYRGPRDAHPQDSLGPCDAPQLIL